MTSASAAQETSHGPQETAARQEPAQAANAAPGPPGLPAAGAGARVVCIIGQDIDA